MVVVMRSCRTTPSCCYPKTLHSKKTTEIHGISTKMMREQGIPAKEAISKFFRLAIEAHEHGVQVVAHNASFDHRLLLQMARTNRVDSSLVVGFESVRCFCTMRASKHHFFFPDNRNKYPKNVELYERLFGSAPTGTLHNALVDVRVTAASYLEGTRRGWFAHRV